MPTPNQKLSQNDPVNTAESVLIKGNKNIQQIDDYINIGDWTAKLCSRLLTGAGFSFHTENKEMSAVFQRFAKINNLGFVLEHMAYQIARQGSSVITIDLLNDEIPLDLRLGFVNTAYTTKLYESNIGVSLWKNIIISETNLTYQIKEIWTETEVRRFFYYNSQMITIGEFMMSVPKRYQILASNRLFKAKTDYFLVYENKLGIIPIVEFRLDKRKSCLFASKTHEKNWNTQINQLITEIQKDVMVTKPRFIFSTLTTAQINQLNNTDITADLVLVGSESGDRSVKQSILQSRDRYSLIADTLSKQLKNVLSQIGLSADISSSQTTSAGESKEGSSQVRFIRQLASSFNFFLRKYFEKVFQVAGFDENERVKFNIKLNSNLSVSEAELINNEISKLTMGLTSLKEAQNSVNTTEAEVKIKQEVTDQQNEKQDNQLKTS